MDACAGGVMKRLDLAINDKDSGFEYPYSLKSQQEECIPSSAVLCYRSGELARSRKGIWGNSIGLLQSSYFIYEKRPRAVQENDIC